MSLMMGHAKLLYGTVATGTAQYASGDVVGGTLTFSGANFVNTSGMIASVNVVTQSGGSLPLTLAFFKGTPVTAADNAPGTFSASNLSADLIGQVSVTTSDYVLMGTAATPPCAAYKPAVAIPYQTSAGGALYCIPIARAAHTFTSTSDLIITVSLLQD